WLPFEGSTDEIWFAVRPVREGVGVLRYTIYYRQHVLQTFRLAALTVGARPRKPRVAAAERKLLAAALDAPPNKIPAGTYVTRLEYAAAPLVDAPHAPERRISIVANDVAGNRVVTVKGKRYFFDSVAGHANDRARDLRDELFEASVKKLSTQREDWAYRYGSNV